MVSVVVIRCVDETSFVLDRDCSFTYYQTRHDYGLALTLHNGDSRKRPSKRIRYSGDEYSYVKGFGRQEKKVITFLPYI